jgi:micrococcal nuclease
MYQYTALITDVYDGDTATAIVELGFFVKAEVKIRLYGIDTPEIRGSEREKGLLSKIRLEELILNKVVTIKTYKDKQEKYGRWLADIYLTNDMTKSVNTILLEEGLATKYIL